LLIDVGFPLSGPQYRTHTPDLNVMPGTPASPDGLGSATTARRHSPTGSTTRYPVSAWGTNWPPVRNSNGP
jgi:hypothetical protein